MHLHFLDPYRHRQSLIHTLDPRVKFVFTLAFILTMALLPFGAWPVYVLMLTVSLSITVLSELGVKYVLKRSLLAIPFVLAAVPLLFTVKGPVLLTIPIGELSPHDHVHGCRALAQHHVQIVGVAASRHRVCGGHALSRYAAGDARRQNSAPARQSLRPDVALHVCDGRRSDPVDAGARGAQRRSRSARREIRRPARVARQSDRRHGGQSLHPLARSG